MPLGGYIYDFLFDDPIYAAPFFSLAQPPPTVESPIPEPGLPGGTRPDAAERQRVLRHALREIMPPPVSHTSAIIDSESDDDLVEIVSAHTSRPSSTVPSQPPPLMLPRPGARPLPAAAAAAAPAGSRRGRPAASTRPSRPAAPRQDGDDTVAATTAVIDLTEEPDSPVEVRSLRSMLDDGPVRLPPIRTQRHPRRTNSQRTTPPRLSRSESIMLATQTSFIDLTGDDDTNDQTHHHNTASNTTTSAFPPMRGSRGPQRAVMQEFGPPMVPPMTRGANRRSNRNHHNPMLPPHQPGAGAGAAAASAGLAHDHLVDFEFLGPNHHVSGPYNLVSTFARGFGRHLADMLGTGIFPSSPENPRPGGGGANQTRHNRDTHTAHNGGFSMHPFPPHRFQRPPSPRREMPPIPPARPGFTRETRAEPAEGKEGERDEEEQRVVICPACNEELAYDPSDAAATSTPTGAKKRKRTVGDHHFWAVKKCGHVYCAECFENRRPTKACPDGVGFRGAPGKAPNQAPNDLRCAVDGCEAKVANKTEWVGIFL